MQWIRGRSRIGMILIGAVGVLCVIPTCLFLGWAVVQGVGQGVGILPTYTSTATPTALPTPTGTPTAEPTRTPEPPPTNEPTPTPEPTAAISAENTAYFEELAPLIGIIGDSLGTMGRLFEDPDPADAAWLEQVTNALTLLAESDRRIQAIEPPPDFVELHARLEAGTAQCGEGALIIAESFDTQDAARFREGGDLVGACGAVLRELTPEYEAFLP